MKIYLVSQGSYSDWSIVGVFSTYEKAEALRVLVEEANDVEVWELDKIDPKKGMPFLVRSVPNSIEVGEMQAQPESSYAWRNADGVVSAGYAGKLVIQVIARDPSHAAKIAADKFREYKALNP